MTSVKARARITAALNAPVAILTRIASAAPFRRETGEKRALVRRPFDRVEPVVGALGVAARRRPARYRVARLPSGSIRQIRRAYAQLAVGCRRCVPQPFQRSS